MPARRPQYNAVVAGLLVVLGLAAGFAIGRRGAAPDPVDHHRESDGTTPAAAPATRADPTLLYLPERSRRPRRQPTASPVADHSARLTQPELTRPVAIPVGGILALVASLARPGPTLLPTPAALREAGARLAVAVRTEAGLDLLRSRRPEHQATLLHFLATAAPDNPALAALLAAARRDGPCIRHLRAECAAPKVSATALAAAARLGTSRLDPLLLQLARHDVGHAEDIADLASHTPQRPGAVELLVDLWASGTDLDDDRFASWMRALPPSATGHLVDLARSSRRHGHRQRCLRALASRGDPQALPFLLQLVDEQLDAALAAGFALSKLPTEAAAGPTRNRIARSRRPQVLLAALFGMGARDIDESVRADQLKARLTPEEVDFLRDGDFSPSQFAIAARLCRRLSRLTD